MAVRPIARPPAATRWRYSLLENPPWRTSSADSAAKPATQGHAALMRTEARISSTNDPADATIAVGLGPRLCATSGSRSTNAWKTAAIANDHAATGVMVATG